MADPIQQQLIAARRNQILDAAAVVFAEKGFHPTTIRDVAKQAGIADGTIYNYFASKPALLLGIFERMRESIISANPPLTSDAVDLRAFIRLALVHPLMALRANNFALFRIIVSEMMVNEELRTLYYQQILEPTLVGAQAYFEAQAATHDIAPDDAALIVRAMSGMMLGLMLQYIMGDPVLEARWDELPDLLTNLIMDGLNRPNH